MSGILDWDRQLKHAFCFDIPLTWMNFNIAIRLLDLWHTNWNQCRITRGLSWSFEFGRAEVFFVAINRLFRVVLIFNPYLLSAHNVIEFLGLSQWTIYFLYLTLVLMWWTDKIFGFSFGFLRSHQSMLVLSGCDLCHWGMTNKLLLGLLVRLFNNLCRQSWSCTSSWFRSLNCDRFFYLRSNLFVFENWVVMSDLWLRFFKASVQLVYCFDKGYIVSAGSVVYGVHWIHGLHLDKATSVEILEMLRLMLRQYCF